MLPKGVREQLMLQRGNEFTVEIDKGKIILEPVIGKTSSLWRRWKGSYSGRKLLEHLIMEHRKEVARDDKNI